MTQSAQAAALARDLRAVLNRYADEFDLNLESVVCVLELIKADIVFEHLDDDDE